jgi:DNA-binding transcriptional LysR family regulator
VELTHLRYFLHVATSASFARAATAVAVTPPALSKAVRALEDELGVRLLERTTRTVRLTRAGEIVLAHCHSVLDIVESMRRDVASAAGAIEGVLRVGAMEVFSIEVLPAAIARLVARHPRVVPQIHELVPQAMTDALDRGLLDVGFTIGAVETAGVTRAVLGTSPARIVCGPGHPRYGARTLRARDRDLPWVVPRFFGMPAAPSLDQFPDERQPRSVGATIELLQAGIALACSGRYLGCFPEISIRRELRAGRLRALRGGPAISPFELSVLTRRRTTPSPTVEALIGELRAVLVS